MATPNKDEDVFVFDKFLGLRNNVGPGSFNAGDLEAALNVDVTDEQRLQRRKGYAATTVVTSHHSLWSNGAVALAVIGSSLVEVLPNLTTVVVRSDLTAGAKMYYTSAGNRVFYSNGLETGVFQHGISRSWGLDLPSKLPLSAVIGGSLPAGTYQYVMTYLRDDGQESGAGRSGLIELPAVGGIHFSDMPMSEDPTVEFKRLYVSPVNGDKLYLLMTLPAAATDATYTTERTGTLPLSTQFLSPALAGSHIAEFSGHVLVARGSTLYRSEPFSPELFDLRKGLPFSSPITLVAPVEDGVYLGTTTSVIWLPGRNPAEWREVRRLGYGVIPGTLVYAQADDINDQQGQAAVFATHQGICAGFDGGSVVNLTGDRFNYPVMDEGAAAVREVGGMIQYLVTLRGTERAGNTAF